ncbi:STAS domain-containing protein [Streptomyces sp. NPDC056013]|uniref:STAS domain-containing protein n=1 Tax=Streptomyces sp. NPDC056013 TaxID=3345680 RepID=UPI0035E22BB7
MTSNGTADRAGRPSATHRMVGDVRIVSLQGEIDHTTKDIPQDALLHGDSPDLPPYVVADLEGVSFLDSSGLEDALRP